MLVKLKLFFIIICAIAEKPMCNFVFSEYLVLNMHIFYVYVFVFFIFKSIWYLCNRIIMHASCMLEIIAQINHPEASSKSDANLHSMHCMLHSSIIYCLPRSHNIHSYNFFFPKRYFNNWYPVKISINANTYMYILRKLMFYLFYCRSYKISWHCNIALTSSYIVIYHVSRFLMYN